MIQHLFVLETYLCVLDRIDHAATTEEGGLATEDWTVKRDVVPSCSVDEVVMGLIATVLR